MLASDSSFVPGCYIILDQQRITKWEGTVAKVNNYNFFIRHWNIMWKIYSSASGGEVAQGAEPPANGFVKLGLGKLHGVLNFLLMVLWTSGCKTQLFFPESNCWGVALRRILVWQCVRGRLLLSLSADAIIRCLLNAAFYFLTVDSTEV